VPAPFLHWAVGLSARWDVGQRRDWLVVLQKESPGLSCGAGRGSLVLPGLVTVPGAPSLPLASAQRKAPAEVSGAFSPTRVPGRHSGAMSLALVGR